MMPALSKKALSAAFVRTAKPKLNGQKKPVDTEYPDSDRDPGHAGVAGLVLRVRSGGQKSWMFRYRTKEGLRRKLGLGPFPDISLAKARRIAEEKADQASKGRDPADERRQQKATERKSEENTFEAVVEEYIERAAKKRQRTWAETRRTLLTNCSAWKKRPIKSISKRDALQLLEGFIEDGHQEKARVTLSWLRTLWKWAWARDIVDEPLMDAVQIDIVRKVRERSYSDDEIKALWSAANKMGLRDRGYLKLLLLLGVRKNELAKMRRDEIFEPDDDNYPEKLRIPNAPPLWIIPFERTKSRKTARKNRVYVVPLPRLAYSVYKGLPDLDDDLVFPGRGEGKAMSPGSKLQKEIQKMSGIDDWSYHPCRDTLATWLQDKGYAEYERGIALNHSGAGSVTGDYSHGFPVSLKLDLLSAWADHVEELVTPAGATEVLR